MLGLSAPLRERLALLQVIDSIPVQIVYKNTILRNMVLIIHTAE